MLWFLEPYFASPSALIDDYLCTQLALQAQGWRPRMTDIEALA